MKFAAWQKESFNDYPGKISTLLFTPGCNYDCGYCHNPELKIFNKGSIDEKEIFDYILERKGWIDAVVISGGEPTLKNWLKSFARKIKDLGFLVKLDTNGSNAGVLQELKDEKLIDYVAMDVKGPLNLYAQIIGRKFIDERDFIGKGIALASQFPDYEFRTTLIPIFENGEVRWMSPEEIGETAKLIYNWSLKERESNYVLQPFKAIEKESENKNKFSKNQLPKEMVETPKKHLEKCLIAAQKYLPNTKDRE